MAKPESTEDETPARQESCKLQIKTQRFRQSKNEPPAKRRWTTIISSAVTVEAFDHDSDSMIVAPSATICEDPWPGEPSIR